MGTQPQFPGYVQIKSITYEPISVKHLSTAGPCNKSYNELFVSIHSRKIFGTS